MGVKTIKPPVKNISTINGRCSHRRLAKRMLFAGRKKKHIYQSLLGFDITALPSFLTILSGTLNVFLLENSCPQIENIIDVHQVLSPWCKRKDLLIKELPVASASISNINCSFVSFDITPLIVDWYTGGSVNLGILLKLRNQQKPGLLGFCSNRFFNSRYWPFVEISFLDPVPGECCYQTLDADESVTTSNIVQTTARINVQRFNYTYYIINSGLHSATVSMQLSPDGTNWMTDVPPQVIIPGGMLTFVPNVIARFARLAFQSAMPNQNTILDICVRGCYA
ncbi:DUF6385 domain-containing protein [Sporomusa sp.]|uniref:DUF6385 domain-containing protein n=1 Tax=Sporomusa sp. TaxID=2078658 RepID=UPI002C613A0E|nr:DUF6385 domain-containing protein [Sporomusa sp.]HWR45119.1 DUF6385 domain-containing protein [Sporomusa sp.]